MSEKERREEKERERERERCLYQNACSYECVCLSVSAHVSIHWSICSTITNSWSGMYFKTIASRCVHKYPCTRVLAYSYYFTCLQYRHRNHQHHSAYTLPLPLFTALYAAVKFQELVNIPISERSPSMYLLKIFS